MAKDMIGGQLGTTPEKAARITAALQGVLDSRAGDTMARQKALQVLIAEITAGRF